MFTAHYQDLSTDSNTFKIGGVVHYREILGFKICIGVYGWFGSFLYLFLRLLRDGSFRFCRCCCSVWCTCSFRSSHLIGPTERIHTSRWWIVCRFLLHFLNAGFYLSFQPCLFDSFLDLISFGSFLRRYLDCRTCISTQLFFAAVAIDKMIQWFQAEFLTECIGFFNGDRYLILTINTALNSADVVVWLRFEAQFFAQGVRFVNGQAISIY